MSISTKTSTMSASLGMDTTAEGVETVGQLNTLKLEGCTEVQGYLFSKPRLAKDIRKSSPRSSAPTPQPDDVRRCVDYRKFNIFSIVEKLTAVNFAASGANA